MNVMISLTRAVIGKENDEKGSELPRRRSVSGLATLAGLSGRILSSPAFESGNGCGSWASAWSISRQLALTRVEVSAFMLGYVTPSRLT